MNDTVCLLDALDLVRARLAQPGVLRGRQRSPEFRDKVLRAAKLILARHIRAVREMSRLGATHRIPFARRAVSRLCGVAAWALARVIPILVRIGLLTDRSPLARWCEGPHRSITQGAEPYWFRPSLFSIGSDYAAVLIGADFAGSTAGNQCAPDVSSSLFKVSLEDRTGQVVEEVEESSKETIRRALFPPPAPEMPGDEVNGPLEAALAALRRAVVPSATINRLRAYEPSSAEALASLEANRGTLLNGVTLSPAALRRSASPPW